MNERITYKFMALTLRLLLVIISKSWGTEFLNMEHYREAQKCISECERMSDGGPL